MPWQLGPTMRTPLSVDGALQLVFQLAALGAGLAEAGGQHHGERNAGLAAVAHGLRDAGRRHGDDGEVARLADRHGVRIALEAVHLRILRIDRDRCRPCSRRS